MDQVVDRVITISDDNWNNILKNVYKLGFFERRKANKHRSVIEKTLEKKKFEPALVISTNPLLIAVYSYEMDGVVILEFPKEFVLLYKIRLFDKYVASNTYINKGNLAYDIFVGKRYLRRYTNFNSTIISFLSDDEDLLKLELNKFSVELWEYVKALAVRYQNEHNLKREGFWFISA